MEEKSHRTILDFGSFMMKKERRLLKTIKATQSSKNSPLKESNGTKIKMDFCRNMILRENNCKTIDWDRLCLMSITLFYLKNKCHLLPGVLFKIKFSNQVRQ